MANNSSGEAGGGVGLLGVIIGAALVIAVAFFFLGGFGGTAPQRVDVTVTPPAAAPAPAPAAAPAATPAPSAAPAPATAPKP